MPDACVCVVHLISQSWDRVHSSGDGSAHSTWYLVPGTKRMPRQTSKSSMQAIHVLCIQCIVVARFIGMTARARILSVFQYISVSYLVIVCLRLNLLASWLCGVLLADLWLDAVQTLKTLVGARGMRGVLVMHTDGSVTALMPKPLAAQVPSLSLSLVPCLLSLDA
jgi:hypothetical protein